MEEITEHQNYVTLKFPDEDDSKSYQCGIEKANQSVLNLGRNTAYSKHKDLEGGEHPNLEQPRKAGIQR